MSETTNERLSNWVRGYCWCGRWHLQPSPQRSPEGVCYEREEGGLYVRTWTATGAGAARTYAWAGPEHCEACGYDLTATPAANLATLTAEDWAGVIRNAQIGAEELTDCIPEGAEPTFVGCNLDNVVLPSGVTMAAVNPKGKRATPGVGNGVPCCHNRIIVQTDGRPWLCKWTGQQKPIQAVDHKQRILDGRSVDPQDLPADPLTPEEITALDDAIETQRLETKAARKAGWAECECLTARKAEAAGKGVHAPHKVLGKADCELCHGRGHVDPEVAALRAALAAAQGGK